MCVGAWVGACVFFVCVYMSAFVWFWKHVSKCTDHTVYGGFSGNRNGGCWAGRVIARKEAAPDDMTTGTTNSRFVLPAASTEDTALTEGCRCCAGPQS